MKRVHLVALVLFALLVASPMSAYADTAVSITQIEETGAQAVFTYTVGCITTNVVAGVGEQEFRNIPGNIQEKPTFVVSAVQQFSSSENGPDCGDFLVQDSFFASSDPSFNFHLIVLQVDPSLQKARMAGSGTFSDFANNIERDMAFDITWQATSPLQVHQDQHQSEENGEIVTTLVHVSERRAIASGFIKQCDTSFEGTIDGLCSAEDLATAENLIPVPSDPEQTNLFSNVFTEQRRPAP